MWYGVAGHNGGWDVTCMVPLFITSDSVLTHPLLEPASFPQPWVGSRAHPLASALPSSTLVPVSEGRWSGGLLWSWHWVWGEAGAGGQAALDWAAQVGSWLRGSSQGASAESLGPLSKALVTGYEGGRWRQAGRGL